MDKYVLVVLIISIVLIFFFLLFFVIYNTYNYRQYEQGTSQFNSVCDDGYCPTDILTGEKNCDSLVYNPATQVCSLPDSCSNQLLPYAMSPDGSATAGVKCTTDRCRCLPIKQCNTYTLANFTLSNQGYTQNGTESNGLNNPVSDSSLCSIPVEAIFDLGCNKTEWVTQEDALDNISNCIIINPCLRGQLAYLADPSTFDISSLTLYPLTCVIGNSGLDSFGNPIEQGNVAIWDSNWGGVVQKRPS